MGSTDPVAPNLGTTRLVAQPEPLGTEPLVANEVESDRVGSDGLADVLARLAARLDNGLAGPVETSEAAAVPDWMTWLGLAGLLSLSSSKFARWWRSQRQPRWRRLSRQDKRQASGLPWRTTVLKPHLSLMRTRRSNDLEVADSRVLRAERG
jgi:hypothetical protein